MKKNIFIATSLALTLLCNKSFGMEKEKSLSEHMENIIKFADQLKEKCKKNPDSNHLCETVDLYLEIEEETNKKIEEQKTYPDLLKTLKKELGYIEKNENDPSIKITPEILKSEEFKKFRLSSLELKNKQLAYLKNDDQ